LTNYTLDGHDLSDLFSSDKPLIPFTDDITKYVPEYGSIIYTVWDLDEKFIYVGIGGTQGKKPLKERDPRSRIISHRSGRRSGDQFCCYVHDYYVIPELVKSGGFEHKKSYLDILTREYIHRNLRYRVKDFQTEDGIQIVRKLEKIIRKGFFGTPPLLNGLPDSW